MLPTEDMFVCATGGAAVQSQPELVGLVDENLNQDSDIYPAEVVEAVSGPGGLQPPVVAAVAVCGGDFPSMSDYEKLRESNIRERDEAMKEAMEEIEEAKQDMRDNAPGPAKRAAKEETGRRRQGGGARGGRWCLWGR